MKKFIILFLSSILLISCSTSNVTSKTEHTEYVIKTSEKDNSLVQPITEYLESNKLRIYDFFEIEQLNKKAIIVIHPTLENWITHYKAGGRKYEDWIVGYANNSEIHMLSFYEFQKLNNGHKYETMENYQKTILHEFIHLCHQQKMLTKNYSCPFFIEGLASYLANQNYGNIDLSKYDDDFFTTREGWYKNVNYGAASKAVGKLINNLPKETIMNYVIDSEILLKDKETILNIIKSK